MNKVVIFVTIAALSLIGYFILIPENTTVDDSEDRFQLAGEVLQTESYCGGAPPQREVFMNESGEETVYDQAEDLATPRPISGKVLHIKSGSENIIGSDPVETVTTDSEGMFTALLSPGTYCVVEEKKQVLPSSEEYAPGGQYGVDRQCLEDAWRTCDKVIEITHDTTTQITYHKDCFWNKDCTFCKGNTPCPVPQ